MKAATLAFSQVPAAGRATGYRLQPVGTHLAESPLPHGLFGAMGGLLTNANDRGKYVAFHLPAWPPRDDAEAGPVRRSPVREMSQLWTPANLTAVNAGRVLRVTHSGYGLGIRSDCRFQHIVGHSGGLPGFGSYMAWLPEHGVGIYAMATLTYSGAAGTISQAWDLLRRTGGARKRETTPPSPALAKMRGHIWNLWREWTDAEGKEIAAINLFLDAPIYQRRDSIRRLKEQVFSTLAPTRPPSVQHLEFRKLESPGFRMAAPTGDPAGVACPE